MKSNENVTIPRQEFNRLVKRGRQLVYINFFLIHICASRNIDLVLMAEDICELLHISPEQLENARKKGHIRCGGFCLSSFRSRFTGGMDRQKQGE
ncbi:MULTISPECIES: hypothetical protein [unclassified Alistipes]|jgi:hypothetical protein|uniref:hypothetical protein n=1 Tax=unclassified Alistipes TaxID=2608932 RepID=UPI000E5112AF|nr:hypothetical protein [Alistipes sp. AF48-12]RHO66390.1 hypothetical protein DW082_13840 [Alistipes sp. AF48-12]